MNRNQSVLQDPLWNKFIEEYSHDLGYWYVPKGMTVSVDNLKRVKRQLQILERYEGENWRQCQRRYTRDLKKEGIVEHRGKRRGTDYSAISRVIKVIFDLLGVAWIDEQSTIYITSVGRAILNGAKPTKIVQKQLLKYQFSNPSYKERYFHSIRLFPHVALLRFLLEFSRDGISKEEYLLFVCRTQDESNNAFEIKLN